MGFPEDPIVNPVRIEMVHQCRGRHLSIKSVVLTQRMMRQERPPGLLPSPAIASIPSGAPSLIRLNFASLARWQSTRPDMTRRDGHHPTHDKGAIRFQMAPAVM